MIIKFTLDGTPVETNVSPRKRLVDLLREDFKKISVHSECGNGTCGRCTVLMNEHLTAACLVPAFMVKGKNILTFEGFKELDSYKDIALGFRSAGCFPCQNCESSRFLASHNLLETSFRPSEEIIAGFMSFITCGCVDFTTLFAGLREAGRIREERVGE